MYYGHGKAYTTVTKLSWMLLYIKKWGGGGLQCPPSDKKNGKQHVGGNNYRAGTKNMSPKVQPEIK